MKIPRMSKPSLTLVLALPLLMVSFQNCSISKGGLFASSGSSESTPGGPTVDDPIADPAAFGFNSLPELSDVNVEVRWNTAVVSFKAVAGAKDYRIYALPASGKVSFDSNGVMSLSGAVYRCSGLYGSTPVLNLQWPGMSGATQFVIEALDQVCPDQGVLSANALTSDPENFRWKSLSQMQTESSTGEVFINGQQLNGAKPKALARTFVTASPENPGVWDWSMDFAPKSPKHSFSAMPCNITIGTMCFQTFLFQSDLLQVEFNTMESGYHMVGEVLGELRANFVDWAWDTNGKFRINPKSAATMGADKYLHVTMATQLITTARRYPQIIISDRGFPVSDYMVQGNSLVIQTRGNGPYPLEVQVCDHVRWDVNAQCPGFSLGAYWQPGFNGYLEDLIPGAPKVSDLMGWDRKVQFDVYASTKKVYVMLEGKPFGCVNLPSAGVPSGQVFVSFANTLYHSGATDSVPEGAYGNNQMHHQTVASFNNLAFSSGVAAPAWDEAAIPCKAASELADNP